MTDEYKTLENQIMDLWKSRGMEVKTIQVHFDKEYGYWNIKAKQILKK